MIWRRLWVRSDSTLADLHYILQISFGWTDFHLHRFLIYGKEFGIYRNGGPIYDQAAQKVRLADLRLRLRERFLYEYDFGDNWQHDITLEKILPVDPRRIYPSCIGGKRSAPPEDCGGAWQFIKMRQEIPVRSRHIVEEVREAAQARDVSALENCIDAIEELRPWLGLERFDRRAVNLRLQQYAAGDERWREEP